MKIAVISRGWWPSIKGGSEKFISRIAEELDKRGHEVIGITRRLPGNPSPQASHSLIVIYDENPRPLLSSLKFSWHAAQIVNNLDVDVVLINGYWGEASPLFIRKLPKVVIIHDVGLFSSKWARAHPLKHLLRVRILKTLVKVSNAIIVPTLTVQKDLVKYVGADPKKIYVLGFEGVDGPFYKCHEDNDFFDIVQVSRFAPNKGQLITLRAFELVKEVIKNARLWLIGGLGPDPEHITYFQLVKKKAQEIEREYNIPIKIIVNAPDVDVYYKIADVCVFPSLGEEGFGLTVLECMAYGNQ